MRDAVEDTETHGKDAALLELECMTGHRCGQNCSGWQEGRRVIKRPNRCFRPCGAGRWRMALAVLR